MIGALFLHSLCLSAYVTLFLITFKFFIRSYPLKEVTAVVEGKSTQVLYWSFQVALYIYVSIFTISEAILWTFLRVFKGQWFPVN